MVGAAAVMLAATVGISNVVDAAPDSSAIVKVYHNDNLLFIYLFQLQARPEEPFRRGQMFLL